MAFFTYHRHGSQSGGTGNDHVQMVLFMYHQHGSQSGGMGASQPALASTTLKWCFLHTTGMRPVSCLCSTDYFFMLLEAIPGIKIPTSDQPSKALHLEFLLENIESQLGIKKDILSVSEVLSGTIDEQILMIYLALLKWKVKNKSYNSPRKQLSYLSTHKLSSPTPRNTSDKSIFQNRNAPNIKNFFSSSTTPTLSTNANEPAQKAINDVSFSQSYGKRSKFFDASSTTDGKESPVPRGSVYPATAFKSKPTTNINNTSKSPPSYDKSLSENNSQILSTNTSNVTSKSLNISPSKMADTTQTTTAYDTEPVFSSKITSTALSDHPSTGVSNISTGIINTACTTVNSCSPSTINSLQTSSGLTKQTMVSTLVLPILTSSSSSTREKLMSSRSLSPPSSSSLSSSLSSSSSFPLTTTTTTATTTTMTENSGMSTKTESGLTLSYSSIHEGDLWPETQACQKNALNSPSSPYFYSYSTLQLSKNPATDVSRNQQTEGYSEKYLLSYSPRSEENGKQSSSDRQFTDLKKTSSMRNNDVSSSLTVTSSDIAASVKDASSNDNGIYTCKKVFLLQSTELPAPISQVASPLLSFENHSFNQSSNLPSCSENQILLTNNDTEQTNGGIVQESVKDKLVPPTPPLTSPPPFPPSPQQYLPTFLPFKISSKTSTLSQPFPHYQHDGEIVDGIYLAPCINVNQGNSIKDRTGKENIGQPICLDEALNNGNHDRCTEVPENQTGKVITVKLNSQDGFNKQHPSGLTSEKIEFLCEEIGKLKEKVNAMETGRTSLNNSNSSFEDTVQSVEIPGNSPTGDCQLSTTSSINKTDFNLSTGRLQEQNKNQPSLINSLENSKHQQVVNDGKKMTEQQIKPEHSTFQSSNNTLQESNKIFRPSESYSPFSSNVSPLRRGHLWKPWTRTDYYKTIKTEEHSNFKLNGNNTKVSNYSCGTDSPNSLISKINHQTKDSPLLRENSSPKRTESSNGTIYHSLTSSNIRNLEDNCKDLVMKGTKYDSLNKDGHNLHQCSLCRMNCKNPHRNSRSDTAAEDDEMNDNNQHFKETFLKVISSSANNQEFQNLLEKYTCFKENISDRIYLIFKQLKQEIENLKESLQLEKTETHNLRIEFEKLEKLKKYDVEKTAQESQTSITGIDIVFLQQENIVLKEELEMVQEESFELKEDVTELKDYQKGVEKVLNELQEQILKTEYDKQILSEELTLLWQQRKALKLNSMDLDQSFKSDGFYLSRSHANIDEVAFSNPYLIENYKSMTPKTSSPTRQSLSTFPFHLSPVVDGQDRNLKCPETPKLYRTMSCLSQVDRNHTDKSDVGFSQNIWRSRENAADNLASNFENMMVNKNGNTSKIIQDFNPNKYQLGQQNKYQRLYWSDQQLNQLISDNEISNREEQDRRNLFSSPSLPSRNSFSSFEEPSRASNRQRVNNVTFNFTKQTENRSAKQGSALKGILKNVKNTPDNVNVDQSLSKSHFSNFPRKVRSVPCSPQNFSHQASAEDLALTSDMEEVFKPLNSLESLKSPFGMGKRWNSHDSLIGSASKWSESNSSKRANLNSLSGNKTLSHDPYFKWRFNRKSPDVKPLFGNPDHPRWVHTPYNFFLANAKPSSDTLKVATPVFSPTKIYKRNKNMSNSKDSQDTANISETNNSSLEFSRTPTIASQNLNLTNTSKAQEFSNLFSPEQLEYSPNTDEEHNTVVRNLCSVFESSDLSFDGSEPGSAKKIRSWYDLDRNSPTKLTKEQRQYADRLIEKYTKLPSEKLIQPAS
uniref:Calponin-homology (CH) domain-containing protein n=1 Tax=Octopus bimaculoides TaxID=37653 RepID=A0A0L8GR75_OCTBM